MKAAVFVFCSLIGFVIGHYILHGAVAAYASVLISYHLYLAFLIAVAENEKGLSLSLGTAILSHGAFLALLIGLPYLRERVPFFGLISLLVPGLAPFEAMWLFSGSGEGEKTESTSNTTYAESTVEEQEAFRMYMQQGPRTFRKPGRTIDQEFEAWIADRNKKKVEAEKAGTSAATNAPSYPDARPSANSAADDTPKYTF